MEPLLLAGIPTSKVDILRPLLEKYRERLTSSSHMNILIPAVFGKEKFQLYLIEQHDWVKPLQLLYGLYSKIADPPTAFCG